ncbi:hypothetical protein [Petrachloros mirabilis]
MPTLQEQPREMPQAQLFPATFLYPSKLELLLEGQQDIGLSIEPSFPLVLPAPKSEP